MKCYCDASFDPCTKNAVCGWQIGNNPIQLMNISKTTNTKAEIIGLITLINNLDPTSGYIIYTDCESIINRIKSNSN